MAKKHYTTPLDLALSAANNGRVPSFQAVGNPLVQQWNYLRNYLQGQQIFTYSGPGLTMKEDDEVRPHMNPGARWEPNTDPCYEVILHAPPKADTSNPLRQLYGVILPWHIVPHHCRMVDMVTVPAQVTWEADRGASTDEQTIWISTAHSSNWQRSRAYYDLPTDGSNLIHLYNYTRRNVIYDEDMNMDHTLCWAESYRGAVEKVTSSPTPYSGTYCLKVNNDSADAHAQTIIPGAVLAGPTRDGAQYRLKARVHGDGYCVPRLYSNATLIASGAATASWQTIDWTDFEADDTRLTLLSDYSAGGSGYCAFDNIQMEEKGTFKYEPDSSGEFTVGKIRTSRIRVAAMGIWQCPDHVLETAQAELIHQYFQPGKAIRAYDATGDLSLGKMIRRMGDDDLDDDDVERMTRRCVLGFGHPTGIGTTETSYVNIRNDADSWFIIETRNLLNRSGASSARVMPAVVAYADGASGGNPAYVKITSYNSGSADTWTYEITDSGGLYGGVSAGYLEVTAGIDKVKIEIEAPTSGAVWLKTATLWEAYPDW